jgi:hypothetical protein
VSIFNQTKDLSTYSFSLATSYYFEDKRLSVELEKAGNVKKIIVYTGCEVAFLLTTLIGVVETVFWGGLALLLKIPHLFFPASKSKWADRVYAQVIENLSGAILGFSEGAVMSTINYFEPNSEIKETLCNVRRAVDKTFQKLAPLFSYHLFGSPKQVVLEKCEAQASKVQGAAESGLREADDPTAKSAMQRD